MYISLNPFAVHLKLTQYCKPAILQLKKQKENKKEDCQILIQ